jgi:peptidoglycan L-alanyl-D-glutamate endopeptidase CwlK
MPSRSIADLDPRLQPLARAFLTECAANFLEVVITCTFRTAREQYELYALGRTKPGRVVTNAKGGESMHNIVTPNGAPASRAFDVVALRNGKPVWGTGGNGLDDDPTDDDTDDLELWQRIGAIAEGLGLEWAGRWTKFREFPHIQLPGGV